MSKKISFVVAFIIASAVFFLINNNEMFLMTSTTGTNFLIYWYFIWKLLHDKNKD